MSKSNEIIEYIRKHGSITSLEAVLNLHTVKLTTRISELRKAGYNIIGTWEEKNGTRYMRYTLDEL